MTWRVARALGQLRNQVDVMYPNRSRESDGTIGDAAHASRSSDHNPWVKDGAIGVVTGMDITHDPKNGCNSYTLAEILRTGKDSRIKYVISNRRIFSGAGGPNPWQWRKYTGINPHDHHVHVSVMPLKEKYDSVANWNLSIAIGAVTEPVAQSTVPATLRTGMKGEAVERAQVLLNAPKTGVYDTATIEAVKVFQRKSKLVADGVCGPQTWRMLLATAPSGTGQKKEK